MPPTLIELRELLRRGEHQPFLATLDATRPLPEKAVFIGGYVIGEMIFLVDADRLVVRRGPGSLHVLRDGRDVLRRNDRFCWVFENFGDRRQTPVRLEAPGIVCPSALAWMLRQESVATVVPPALLTSDAVTEGEIAGRPTWTLRRAAAQPEDDPGQLVSLEIDQEHGVILAVETVQERIETSWVSFPDSVPDPSWIGPWEPLPDRDSEVPPPPDTAEIPGYVDALPPQSGDPRRLRVFVGETELEGSFPDYHTGQSVRLNLGISSRPAPVPGLDTIRHGLVRNLEEEAHPNSDGVPQWPILLTGDGWTALTHLPTPEYREAEVRGWFYYSAYGMTDVPTDLLVKRVFVAIGPWESEERIWQEADDTADAYVSEGWQVRDVVLDVTLDGAVPPPLEPRIFTPSDPAVDGDFLWLRHVDLPVVRSWDIRTGAYRGQSLVPAPMRDVYPVIELVKEDQLGILATDGRQGWVLTPGAPVAAKAPGWVPSPPGAGVPEFPSPWKMSSSLGEGLFEVWADTETGRSIALARVNPDGGIDVRELELDGYSIGSAVRIRDFHVVRSWVAEYRLDADLQVTAVREVNMFDESWAAAGPAAYLRDGDRLRFLDRATGEELPGLAIPEGHRTQVLSAAGTITVLLYRDDPRNSRAISPTGIAHLVQGVWNTVALEEAPAELFPGS